MTSILLINLQTLLWKFNSVIVRPVIFRWRHRRPFSWIKVPINKEQSNFKLVETRKKNLSRNQWEFTWITFRSAAVRMHGSVNKIWPIRVAPPLDSDNSLSDSSWSMAISYVDVRPTQSTNRFSFKRETHEIHVGNGQQLNGGVTVWRQAPPIALCLYGRTRKNHQMQHSPGRNNINVFRHAISVWFRRNSKIWWIALYNLWTARSFEGIVKSKRNHQNRI